MTAIIQARLNSSRMQHKVLQKIGGKIILKHVIDRCKKLPIDKIILAVSHLAKDEELFWDARNNEIDYFCHKDIKENDLLKRYLMCGIAYDADYILRVPADCPFFSLSAARDLINEVSIPIRWDGIKSTYRTDDYDYIAHYLDWTGAQYPTIWRHSTGKYLEVVRLSALFDVYNRLKEIEEKEIQYVYGKLTTKECYKQHPTSGIYLNPERYKIKRIMIDKLPKHNLAVNTESDLERIGKLYSRGMIK